MAGAAAVEAEGELIEIGLKVLAAQAVIDAERPDLEVGEDAVHPRQDDMGRHLADHMGIMMDARDASITGQSMRLGGSTGGEMGSEEGVQAGGRVIGYLFEAKSAGAGATVLHLDGADNEDLTLAAAPPTADERIVLVAAGKLGLVDLDQTGERGAAGASMLRRSLAESSQALLYEPEESWRCSCRAEMPLEWVAIR